METQKGGNENTNQLALEAGKYLKNSISERQLLSRIGNKQSYSENELENGARKFAPIRDIDLQTEVSTVLNKLHGLIKKHPGNKDYTTSYNALSDSIRSYDFSTRWLYNNSGLKLMSQLNSIDQAISSGNELSDILTSDMDTVFSHAKYQALCLSQEISLDCLNNTSVYTRYANKKVDDLIAFYDNTSITDLVKTIGNGLIQPGIEQGLKRSPYGRIAEAILNQIPEGFFRNNKLGNLIIKGSEELSYDSMAGFIRDLVSESLKHDGFLQIIARDTGSLLQEINIGDAEKLLTS